MLKQLKAKYRGASTFSFGNGPRMADDTLDMVLTGRKTASCGALRDYGDTVRLPAMGQYFIVQDGRRNPGAVIRVTEVVVCPTAEVPETLALATGAYATRDEWLADITAYFSGRGWSVDQSLVCWRFELVEDLTHPTSPRDLVA